MERPAIRSLVEARYEKLDRDAGFRDRVLEQLVELMKGTKEYELLKTIPGVGKVLAGVMSALIGDANRFEGKRNRTPRIRGAVSMGSVAEKARDLIRRPRPLSRSK